MSGTWKYVDALGIIDMSTCFFFKDKVYLKYNLRNHASSEVLSIDNLKLPGNFAQGKFQACIPDNQGSLILFKGSLTVKYNYINGTVGTPLALNLLYRGLPLDYQKGQFDTVVRLGSNQLAFLKDNQVMLYNEAKNIITPFSTPPLNSHENSVAPTTNPSMNLTQYWPNLDFNKIQAMVKIGPGMSLAPTTTNGLLMFRDNQFSIYDLDQKKTVITESIIPKWSGLKIPLLRQRDWCILKPQAPECQFMTQEEYNSNHEALQAQIESLQDIISRRSTQQQVLITESQNYQTQIQNAKAQVNQVRIALELERTQPCQSRFSPCYPSTSSHCSPETLAQVLTKMNLPKVKAQALAREFNSVPEIVTYPTYYQYSKISDIGSCPSTHKG